MQDREKERWDDLMRKIYSFLHTFTLIFLFRDYILNGSKDL